MPKLSDLKDVDFVSIKKEEVETEVFALYYTITGHGKLADGDPVRIFILFMVNVIIMLLNKLNRTGKMNLLKSSEKNFLDVLGALVGTTRLEASAAKAVIQIKLSAEREQETIIPKGTRVSPEKEIYFATGADVIIPAGQSTAQVTAVCTQTGEIGNGYQPGEIKEIVDPIAYVASMVNVSASAGGSDIETDDSLRERIFTAPESYSCAGSEGAYIYHAKSVNSAVIDVEPYSPSPGVVQLVILLTGGTIPENVVTGEIQDALSAKSKRPLTDWLLVTPPEAVSYDIDIKYWIYEDADASEVSSAVYAAIAEYKLWQRTKLGRDINPNEIHKRMKDIAGVKRMEIISPVFTKLSKVQVAQDAKTKIAMEGSEEE
ncbi:MAG: baseplate J/gp47 family protein [Schwartzia sp.]|nr:baseplate J/gp47 family protein [Schwartzia sp. (in: firmicutes)]